MADNKWIHIENWMGKLLGLRANDLICYAIIYAFSRDGKSQYRGDLSYLAASMFATKQTAILCLKKLVTQNLVLKQEETVCGIKRCYYQTNIICDDGKFYIIDPGKEPLMAIKESLTAAIKEPLTVYINDNKENNKENKKGLSKAKPSKGVVSLSPEEQEKEEKFVKKMREMYPRLMRMDIPLTYKKCQDLKEMFERDEIYQALDEIENWKPLLTKRVDAYQTIVNWIKKNRERQ